MIRARVSSIVSLAWSLIAFTLDEELRAERYKAFDMESPSFPAHVFRPALDGKDIVRLITMLAVVFLLVMTALGISLAWLS